MKPKINPDTNISNLQYEKALECINFIKSVLRLREHNISYKDYEPRKNWDRKNPALSDWVKFNDYILENPDYDIINKLRWFTGAFTGHPLLKDFTFHNFLSGRNKLLNLPNTSLIDISNISYNPRRYNWRWYENFLPRKYQIKTPNILGELGYLYKDIICNLDTKDYFERISILNECGVLPYLENRSKEEKKGITFLEIGAGYGFLSYLLMQAIPTNRYFVIDIPESLLFSSIYLSIVFPDRNLIYIDNVKIEDLNQDGIYFIPNMFWNEISQKMKDVDIVLNTLSFHEMPSCAVEDYADKVKKIFKSNNQVSPGFIFEQNLDNFGERNGCNAKLILRNKFYSKVISQIYTSQTRGYSELHSLNKELFTKISNFRPRIPYTKKMRFCLNRLFLLNLIKGLVPIKIRRFIKFCLLRRSRGIKNVKKLRRMKTFDLIILNLKNVGKHYFFQ
ncbi:MAG: putative sugar O-methyltransferase [Elusimicrobiota bacterium]